MSSVSAPFGFRPSYHMSGNVRPKLYTIASGYAANIFQGDPVKLVSTGTIQLGTADGSRGGGGTVDGVKVVGIFAGCEYIDSTGKPVVSSYWPASVAATDIKAYVYDDPETLFDVVYANPGTPGTDSVQTYVGRECDWSMASPGGSTATGISTALLTAIQSTSGQFQITAFSHAISDALTDAYVVATVRINEHQYKASVNTIA